MLKVSIGHSHSCQEETPAPLATISSSVLETQMPHQNCHLESSLGLRVESMGREGKVTLWIEKGGSLHRFLIENCDLCSRFRKLWIILGTVEIDF